VYYDEALTGYQLAEKIARVYDEPKRRELKRTLLLSVALSCLEKLV
jgi:hypothetical protein